MQATNARSRRYLLARSVFWIVAGFYAYGALVHILNMASMTGFHWPEATLKWRILDVVYLALDLVVVVGLLRGSWIGLVTFFGTALSQIALYTVFRDWVLDVPEAYQRAAGDLAYLDGLVAFHVITCIAMGAAIVMLRPDSGHRLKKGAGSRSRSLSGRIESQDQRPG